MGVLDGGIYSLTGYAAGGTPLAVSLQEDCPVTSVVRDCVCCLADKCALSLLVPQ